MRVCVVANTDAWKILSRHICAQKVANNQVAKISLLTNSNLFLGVCLGAKSQFVEEVS